MKYRNTKNGETRAHLAADAPSGVEKGLPVHTRQCVDGHNRPTRAFERPNPAVEKRMTVSLLPATLPFVKKKGVELLKADCAGNAEAGRRIPGELPAYYRGAYPAIASEREADVAAAAKVLVRICDANAFRGSRRGSRPCRRRHEAHLQDPQSLTASTR